MALDTHEIDAWKQLIHLLPTILPEQKNKERIKLNFSAIRQVCADENLNINLFRRLKHAASTIVRESSREKRAKSDGFSVDSSSSESDEDENYMRRLEESMAGNNSTSWKYHSLSGNPHAKTTFEGFLKHFSNSAEDHDDDIQTPEDMPSDFDDTTASDNEESLLQFGSPFSGPADSPCQESTPKTSKTSKFTCNRCGCPVSKATVQHCRPCRYEIDREKRQPKTSTAKTGITKSSKTERGCSSCDGPISINSKGFCKSCHLSRRSEQQSIRKSLSENLVVDLRQASRDIQLYKSAANRVRIVCQRCKNDRVHFAQQMCQTCYKTWRRSNNVIVVKREAIEEESRGTVKREHASSTPISQTLTKRSLDDDSEQELHKRRKTKQCLDCKGSIYPESERCKACFLESKKRVKEERNVSPSSAVHAPEEPGTKENRKPKEVTSNCNVCGREIARRTTTGTCGAVCYKRMYDKQKKLEKAAGNKAESPESVTIDSDDDEEEEEITEQSLGVFKESSDACQNCLSFASLNKRRICGSCHAQEMENAGMASETQKISVLKAYLKSTEKFLQ